MTQDVLDQARAKLKSYGIVEPATRLGRRMTDARWQDFFDVASAPGRLSEDARLAQRGLHLADSCRPGPCSLLVEEAT